MKQPLRGVLAFFDEEDYTVHHAEPANVLVIQGAAKPDYERCLSGLLAGGYALYAEHAIGSNDHATLRGLNHVLHVYFNASESALRVVYDENTTLPDTRPQANGSGSVVLYQFETDHTLIDCGMCYIIQCADGSFFIIDSAHYYSFNDNDRIHKFLRERVPEGKKIVIAGWYFSHGHPDHIGKFMDFLQYNCDDVTIEALYFNFVPPDYFKADSEEESENRLITKKFHRMVDARSDIQKITPHTGQQFFVRNLDFEVLYTHEDVYPRPFDDFNTSSSVLMLRVGETKVLFPGDASGIASDIMLGRYGASLKCDVLQVSHHGHFGLSPRFYEQTRARIALFPTTQIKYDEEYAVFEANRVAVALCDQCFISSNGTVAIPLPYRGEGITFLGDETFEDFAKIKGLWGYEYTAERKRELRDAFAARNGECATIFQVKPCAAE